jgi:hypothetical protein
MPDEANANMLSTPDYYERMKLENSVEQVRPKYNFPDDLGYYYLNLSEQEKQSLLNKTFEEKVAYLKEVKDRNIKELADKTTPTSSPKPSILEVQEPEKESNKSADDAESVSEKRSVTIQEPSESSSESNSSSSNGTKKITL